jgi:hypothetical protein
MKVSAQNLRQHRGQRCGVKARLPKETLSLNDFERQNLSDIQENTQSVFSCATKKRSQTSTVNLITI